MRRNAATGILISAAITLGSTALVLLAGEAILRAKNASMKNYDIEMWRYALELKRRSDIPVLGHEHVASKSATLQSVDIRINEKGLRGAPVTSPIPGKRRILFLGSSVTLGWGVAEDDTMTARLGKMFRADGQDVEVLNAGIGNYNAVRYVERFRRRLADLEPTDIVVHYFLRDAETLDAGAGNLLLRHSELAFTTWVAFSRYFGKASEKTLDERYRAMYQPQAQGYRDMRAALHDLAAYAKEHGISLYLAMTPDVHDLLDYKFGYIHEVMRNVAGEEGYAYIDLLPAMKNLTPAQVWSMPGDPHPNALGHRLMAEAIYPALKSAKR
ncbi:MAG: SGNH/GDSL hydrolase family protein [Usitatibacter sp.]